MTCLINILSQRRSAIADLLSIVATLIVLEITASMPVVAQDWQDRKDFAAALQQQLDVLEQCTNSCTTQVPLNYGAISIRSYDGTCEAVDPNDQVELIYDDNNPGEFVFRFPLKGSSSIDVPIQSHRLPCQLNLGWFYHMWRGGLGQHDTGKAYGLDDICSPVGQKYFMQDWNSSLSMPLSWFSGEAETIRMLDNNGIEVGVNILPKRSQSLTHLIYESKGSEVLTFRDEGMSPAWNRFKLAKQELLFDYTKAPENTDQSYFYRYVPHPDIYWNDIDPVNGNANGSEYRLEKIEIRSQFQTPNPDYCTNGPTLTNPGYSVTDARIIVAVTYKDGTGTTVTQEAVTKSPSTMTTALEANDWLWSLRNVNNAKAWEYMYFDVDEDGYMYLQITDHADWPGGIQNKRLYTVRIHTDQSPEEYCEMVFPKNGKFCVDNMTGDIVYYTDPNADCPCTIGTCDPLSVTCIDYCTKLSGYRTVENVLAASASTLSADWMYDPALITGWNEGVGLYPNTFYGDEDNRFQRGQDGLWRLKQTFVYRTNIKKAVDGEMVYDNAGVFVDASGNTAEAFRMFNWRVESENDPVVAWLDGPTVVQYAPSGEAVEEKNTLGIYSAARLSHKQTVAALIAGNARYDAVGFESFEEHDDAATTSPFKEEITSDFAHSGLNSYALNPNGGDSDPLLSFVVSSQTIAPLAGSQEKRGVLVRFWVKRQYEDDPPGGEAPLKIKIETASSPASPVATLSTNNAGTFQPNTLHKVAQTGEWSLYQFIKNDFSTADDGLTFDVILSSNLPSTSLVWVDDIRVQPLNAQMTCYVYDPNTLRLVTEFDDQHFGAYYQYNGEGQLVRTLRETERGLLTVAESQYHSYNSPRYPFTPATSTTGSHNPFSSINNNGSGSAQSSAAINTDLLELHIDSDGTSLGVLGSRDSSLPVLKSSGNLGADFPSVNELAIENLAPELEVAEKMRLIRELQELDREKKDVQEEVKSDISAEGRIKAARRLEAIEARRTQILHEKFGLTEEEIRILYKQFSDDEVQSEVETSNE